jgi:hypothetical protein
MKNQGVCACCLIVGLWTGAAPQTPFSVPKHIDASVAGQVQIDLALSAAPPEVSRNATVYILGKQGYEKVRDGSNGFTCAIDREYVNTIEPECFDAEGTATIFPTRLRTEELRAQGKTEAEISRDIESGYKTGRFHAPRKTGVVYMMSNHNRVFNPEAGNIIPFPAHLMFYAPYITEKDIGSPSGHNMPFVVHPGKPDALIIVIPAK